MKFLKSLFSFLTFNKITARFCPKCYSLNVHRVFRNEDQPNFVSILLGVEFKCYDCKFKSVFFPERTFKKDESGEYKELEEKNENEEI